MMYIINHLEALILMVKKPFLIVKYYFDGQLPTFHGFPARLGSAELHRFLATRPESTRSARGWRFVPCHTGGALHRVALKWRSVR